VIILATSSFDKIFIVTSKEEIDSIIEAMDAPEGIKIDRTLTSPDKIRRGVLKLKQILSR
jgi:hypothetical protein